MATDKFSARLARRFSGLNSDQLTAAISDGLELLGHIDASAVPENDTQLVLAFLSAEIATDLATNAADFFSFTDGEESIDKTKVMANYTALAAKFRADYELELAKREAAAVTAPPNFYVMKRADRD